jgi:feruloyl esterase
MEAMRYPDDFDGIIAGAPYLDIRVHLAGYKNAKAFLNAFIPPALLPAIDAAIKTNCDAADGVLDGLIQNPAKCSFDPDTLVPGTLTQAQADALEIFFRAVRDEDGDMVFPGSSVSDLSDNSGFGGFIPWAEFGPPLNPMAAQPWGNAAPLSWRAADGVIRYMVERDSNFNSNLGWPETEGIVAQEALKRFDRMTRLGATDEPKRLSRYVRQGKKLILYHGFGDQTLSPFGTTLFYERLAHHHGGYSEIQENARLFMAPGLLHCAGGPGPNAFETLTALEDWVERGVAPNTIIATHYVNNNPALGVDRTMPLCTFPEQARYSGSGNINDASNWTCPKRDRRLLQMGANGVLAGLGDEDDKDDKDDKDDDEDNEEDNDRRHRHHQDK